MGLEEELRRLNEEIEREQRLREALDKGRRAMEEKKFREAETYFKKALEIDSQSADARAGLIGTLYRAGQDAESRGRRREAIDYYRALLAFDPSNIDARVRLNAVQFQLRLRWAIGAIAASIVLLLVFLQVKGYIAWPESVCNAPQVGLALCGPSPTPTPTHTPTPTPTPTFTPTPTPTYTPTPTSTPTPTPTPTPVPLLGRVRYSFVKVYANPTGDEEITRAVQGSVWHLCAQYGDRYLVASDYCHTTAPLGWITITNIEPLFIGQFPPYLITPTPSPGG